MASTSSQPLVGCGKYDVFINHRGIDTKDSLASAIYDRLDSIGVRAFLDREELEAGEKISDAINEAIWSASVHIAIFSPNYAQSRWCLDELTLMLKTDMKIIPIFYRVEPSQLRWLRGVYSQAFSKHENDGRYTPEKLEEWKKALFQASHFYGYEVNDRQNDDCLLLEKIVNDITKEMRKTALLHVATHPVGLDEAIEEFQKFVETQFHTRSQCAQILIVGIAGIGGCGKTTLVKEYYNQKRSFYSKSSFLYDIRNAATENRLRELQEKLLEDLVHIKEKIHHKSEGRRTLERRVRFVKALIVLDDVDDTDQIEDLLPLEGNLQPGSLIIVTTRDSRVITSSASLSPSVSATVYRKKYLNSQHAKQLFCSYAFSKDFPVNGFEDLVDKFITFCQGLPLSLKVFGAQLYDNDRRDSWESVLHKISKILPHKIKEILKVSYDALDEEEKQMFLDIACFLIGEQKDKAISIWDGSSWDGSSWDGSLWSGLHGFEILENKSLVEVDHDNCTRMHDHLRDLGREIANKSTPSRFWSHSQFVNSQRPLEGRLPIRAIMAATGSRYGYSYCNSHYEPPFEECMQLLTGQSTSRCRRITPSALGLQILSVRGDYFKEQFAKLSEELRWLRWYDFPHEKIPSWLSRVKLRVLELYGADRLAELWGPNDPPPQQLRELIITLSQPDTCNSQRIPETIGFLKHLKKIVFKPLETWQWERERLQIPISSLPEEFCRLESLEHLELQNASDLSSLPTHFGNLRKLKYINLRGCRRLAALPVSSNQLTELQCLDLSDCSKLQFEKDSLKNVTKLENLRLGGCSNLQQLPSEITRQMYLRELCLSGTRLRELPVDIDRLAKLKVLEIGSDCLTSLPTSLGNLSSLIKLKIEHCRQLTHWPSVGCLTGLENMELESLGVEYLPEGFGQLVNLQNLKIRSCPIKDLPLANPEESYYKKLPKLKSISLGDTKVSTISISEDCCPGLEELDLDENHDLMEIETLPTTLKYVQIYGCEKLENIRVVAVLAELQRLNICDCPIRELPLANPEEPYSKKPTLSNHVDSSMFKWPRLKSIRLWDTKVSTISISEDCCPGLEGLSLERNHNLMEIETLPTTLKSVVIRRCEKLKNIRVVAVLAELHYLDISDCPITELPLADTEEPYPKEPRLLNHVDSSMFKFPKQLKYLTLRGTEVSTISISEDCCPSLEYLQVRDLTEIETLPTTLESVTLSTCEKLPSFAGLVHLRSLCIYDCDELPSFACCTCLEDLQINVSSRVTKIEGLEELRSLTTLSLQTSWKEPGIKRLKNLDKLTSLQIRAESRSAIETCIPPNIMKRAYKIVIVGRAVENVESVVGSLSFPNFTVVNTLYRSQDNMQRWEMKSPVCNASCIMACFVISCSSPGIGMDCGLNAGYVTFWNTFYLLEGKQVYIGVWAPKRYLVDHSFMERSYEVFLYSSGDLQIEKAMAVIMREGEEGNEALEEALHKFLELLAR